MKNTLEIFVRLRDAVSDLNEIVAGMQRNTLNRGDALARAKTIVDDLARFVDEADRRP